MRKLLPWALAAALILGPLALGYAALSPAPLIAEPNHASAENALAVQSAVRRARDGDSAPDGPRRLVLTVAEINGLIAFATRLVPGVRADAALADDGLSVRMSAPLPVWPELGWINVSVVVPPFEAGPTLAALRVGALDLPPRLSVALGEGVVNLALGGGAGTRLRRIVQRMEIEGDRVAATLRSGGKPGGSMGRAVAQMLRGEEMPTPERIAAHALRLRVAIEDGTLPAEGSLLPHLRFMLRAAREDAAPGEAGRAVTAALFALAQVCGEDEFRRIAGHLAGEVPAEGIAWTRGCEGVRLAGREDSRLHFVIAAALKAASTLRVSFTIGEFKELVDSVAVSNGYDFTDIAANASGIRFAETVLRTDPAGWEALAARLEAESDVLVSFEGLPGRLPAAEFLRRFGALDSPAYAAMIERIETSVRSLPFHAGAAPTGG